jgi:hypothetical protein
VNAFQVIDALRQQVPEIEGLFSEHIKDNDELLPHVFMADVTRFVEETQARAEHGSSSAENVLQRLLGCLERASAIGDESAKELIVASFIQNLDRENPHFDRLTRKLGRSLMGILERQRSIFLDDLQS